MLGGGGMGRGGRDMRQFQFSGRRGAGGGGFFDRGGEMTNFLVGGQDGNTNTYSFGSNLMDVWWNDLNVNASYFFNYSKNRSEQTLNREYFSTSSQNQLYNEYSSSSTDNFNHRINARLDYKIDSLNSLLISPRIYFQDNSSSSSLQGLNFYSETNPINSTNNINSSNTGGFNFSNEFLFRHRFELEGRTISLRFTSGMNNKNSDNDIYSLSKYFKNSTTVVDTIDQKSDQKIRNFNISSNLTYTEPIGSESQLLANVGLNFTQNSSDKKSFSYDNVTNLYNILDTLQTNEYTNKYFNIQAGLSYRLRSETYNFSAGVSYQRSSLMGDQKFPFTFNTKNTFENILPNAQLRLRFSGNNNIRVNYSTNINPPSITQLQNTVDNSNPLFLRTGNPELDAEYSHRLSSQILTTNLETGATFFAMIFFGFTKNYIGNVTINATKDTLLPNGILLDRGTQITYPINFDHSLSMRSFINGGFPIDFIGCNLNLNASFNYSLTPGLINEHTSRSKSYSIGIGTFLSSNISEELDFRISYNPIYNISKNDLRDELNRNYYVHNA
ncbi:MAG: outer membrane beta-barrel family protein, partial [Ignavibacteria bacterium]|nr:outer membrane beta-barrel family protein [Ignavibacteria bacterium]